MPATHRIEIFKLWGTGRWANSYLLSAASMNEAADLAEVLGEFERQIHKSILNMDYIRVSTLTVGDRVFRHIPFNLPGAVPIGTTGHLPAYCTVRIDLTTQDSDPGRKFYRLPLNVDEVSNGQLTPAYITFLQGKITTFLTNTVVLDNIYTPNGNVVTGATVHPYIQERQLRRRKRYPEPVTP